MLMKKIKLKKGFSLLELLLVMGIIAALIIAAFIIFPKIQSSQRVNAEIGNISAIDSGIKSLYSTTVDYSGINTTTLLKAKVFPDNMILNGLVYNSFKGRVNIEPSSYSDGEYQLTYYGVPDMECSKITSAVFNKFRQVQVNSKVIKTKYQNITVDIASITEMCNSNNNNRLIFNSF